MCLRILIVASVALVISLGGASAASLSGPVKVSKKDCRWLVRHRPAADVAFKPGTGVNGRRVKPADLNPESQIKVPDIIAIPLHVPLRNLLKKGAKSQVGASEVGVGKVTVDRHSGEVKYQGKTLAGSEADRMVIACRKLLRGKY